MEKQYREVKCSDRLPDKYDRYYVSERRGSLLYRKRVVSFKPDDHISVDYWNTEILSWLEKLPPHPVTEDVTEIIRRLVQKTYRNDQRQLVDDYADEAIQALSRLVSFPQPQTISEGNIEIVANEFIDNLTSISKEYAVEKFKAAITVMPHPSTTLQGKEQRGEEAKERYEKAKVSMDNVFDTCNNIETIKILMDGHLIAASGYTPKKQGDNEKEGEINYEDEVCNEPGCKKPVVGDYNGHGCIACQYHMDKWTKEFEDDYQ